jgi:hypothetical protein
LEIDDAAGTSAGGLLQEDHVAKRKPSALSTTTVAEIAERVAPSTTPPTKVITVPPGGTLLAIVDVGPMSAPYTVSYRGRTLIKGLVDRAEVVDLQPGEQVLGWAFVHTLKNWHHTIGVSVNNGVPIILESKSEANKDQDHSVGFAIVKA